MKIINSEKLKKPNQLVLLKNGAITASQRKIYTEILFQAQQELKKDPTKAFFSFNYLELRAKSGIKDNTNWHLKEDLNTLSKVSVETMDDRDNWGFFNLISDVRKYKNSVEIQLPRTITEALFHNTYYTTINMLVLKSLEGKYAMILYEMALRYQKVKIPEMTIDEFRELTGTIDCYKDFRDIRINVLEAAIKEITEKTDFILSYSLKKRGMKAIAITFTLKLKENQFKIKEISSENLVEKLKKYSKETIELFELVNDEEKTESMKKLLENLLKKQSFELIESNISYTNQKSRTNYQGYLINAIEGDYAKDTRKKESSTKTIIKVNEELENKNKIQEEEQKRVREERAKSRYEILSDEEKESYLKEYYMIPIKTRQKINKKDLIIEKLKEEMGRNI